MKDFEVIGFSDRYAVISKNDSTTRTANRWSKNDANKICSKAQKLYDEGIYSEEEALKKAYE